jgi:hypothetical protein
VDPDRRGAELEGEPEKSGGGPAEREGEVAQSKGGPAATGRGNGNSKGAGLKSLGPQQGDDCKVRTRVGRRGPVQDAGLP